MAHSHDFSKRLVILKTSSDYLTSSGFTQDINSKQILAVTAGILGGKWTPKKHRIEKFKQYFNVNLVIDESDCKFYTYDAFDVARTELYEWF